MIAQRKFFGKMAVNPQFFNYTKGIYIFWGNTKFPIQWWGSKKGGGGGAPPPLPPLNISLAYIYL